MAPQVIICPRCKAATPAGGKFCDMCGAKLDSQQSGPKGGTARDDSHKRNVPEPDKTEVMDPHLGRTLGNRFQIVRYMADGGMGRVYEGRDLFSEDRQKAVAIKVLQPKFLQRDDIRNRFISEGQSLFNISHPNIVRFLAFWEDEKGEPYLVMDYLRGQTLGDLLYKSDTGYIHHSAAIGIALDSLAGLYHLHSLPRPLIHRDIKPDNIWILNNGSAVLMDLGIAKECIEARRAAAEGVVIGTPEYMSPEQAAGIELTPASDQYSLAVTLFDSIAGSVPFRKSQGPGGTAEVIRRHIHEEPPDPRSKVAAIPEFLAKGLLRALAKRPEDRFESCFHFASFLKTGGKEGW